VLTAFALPLLGGWGVLYPLEGAATQGDAILAPIFADNMVLQQQSDVKIWGDTTPGETIAVRFGEQRVTGVANQEGRWSVILQTPTAGGPHQIVVDGTAGGPSIVLTNVMVGEVWICSGQSNMEWPVVAAADAATEIAAAQEFPQVRLFTIEYNLQPQPQTRFGGCHTRWSVCSPESVSSFSAVAYAFGRELNRRLGVPIGLIHSASGGSPCEAWTCVACLRGRGAFEDLLRRGEEDQSPGNWRRPGILYNGMIAPLRGFRFQGVIWYQGEDNVGRGQEYAELFPTMIRCWRKELADNRAFPFVFAQIAPCRYTEQAPSALPEIWDAQLKTFRATENVGMAVTTDLGDLANVHPTNKVDVGLRLAKWALHLGYREAMVGDAGEPTFSGPIYRSYAREGQQIRLSFDFCDGPLQTRDGRPPSHFTIAGADGKFLPADARIDGETVLVGAPGVAEPVAVRFAWSDTAEPNLINAAGLPASPFRTDDLPHCARLP
jgi:sialate O-acetylesterase